MKNAIALITTLLATAVVVGCDSGGVERAPNTAVRVVHAAPSFPTIQFLRERRVEADIAYGAGQAFSFEADQYDFNVEITDLATGQPQQVLGFSETLLEDTDHLFVLLEGAGGLEQLTVAAPRFDTASSDVEIAAVHAAFSQGALDVYLEAPGTDLTGAVPRGSIAYRGTVPASTVAPGDYRFSVTAAGAPASVLFQDTVTLAAGGSYTFVVIDGESPSLASLNVVGVHDTPVRLADENAQSSLRVIQTVSDRQPRDIVLDEQFTTPAFPALPFASASSYAVLAPGQHTFNVTPAGNASVEELEDTIGLSPGREYTSIVTGDGTTLAQAAGFEDRRPIASQAKLRLYNGISGFGTVQFFILLPGGSPATALPAHASTAPAISQAFALPPGDYEVTLLDGATQNVLAGPTPISVAGGGIYGVLGVDNAAGDSAEIVLIDDFN